MTACNFDPFTVSYSKIDDVYDFRSECILAAKKAVNNNVTNFPVVVMMSGGIDSELVGESLLLANKPFRVVIGRLKDNETIFNQHDYCFAERWCHKNNIEILYCDIDIYRQSTVLCDYALSANGFSPQFACHMFIMKWCKDNGYFFIAGNGEMDIVLHDDQYCMMEEQREFTLYNFQKLHSIPGVFQFWKQDARLITAFLKLPTVQRLMSEKVKRILDYKHECFADVFVFELRTKQTGFERIQEWDASLRNPMKLINGHFDHKYYIPILKFI